MKRYTFATESEAWTAIADTLEMIQGMPPRPTDRAANGLCVVIDNIFFDQLISHQLRDDMLWRIDDNLPPHRVFMFSPGAWKPRARFARRCASEAGDEVMSVIQNCPWCGYGAWNGKVCLTCGAKGPAGR